MVWNTDRPQAILNGEVLNIGDTDSGHTFEVINIHEDGIDILHKGKKISIEPKKELIND